jgi:hypothetical protein
MQGDQDVIQGADLTLQEANGERAIRSASAALLLGILAAGRVRLAGVLFWARVITSHD